MTRINEGTYYGVGERVVSVGLCFIKFLFILILLFACVLVFHESENFFVNWLRFCFVRRSFLVVQMSLFINFEKKIIRRMSSRREKV